MTDPSDSARDHSGDAGSFPSSPGVVRRVRTDLVAALVDAVLQVQISSSSGARALLRENVEQRLGALPLRDHEAVRPAVVELVQQCDVHPGGLVELAACVELLAAEDPAYLQVRRVVEETEALAVEPELGVMWRQLRPALERLRLRQMQPIFLQVTSGLLGVLPVHCDSTWSAFVHLVGLNGPAGPIPPWMAFLEVVRDHLDSDTGARVRELVRSLAREWGGTADLERVRAWYEAQTPRPTKAGVLTLVLAPDLTDPDSFSLYSVQRWDDDASAPVRDEEVVVRRKELRAAVASIIARAEEDWAARATELKLEFVLPLSLLNEPVEWWSKEAPTPAGPPLALYHSVIVRSLERLRRPDWHRVWLQRWERLADEPSGAIVLTDLDPDRPDHLRRLEADLRDDERCVGLVLSAPPDADTDRSQEIMVALRAGIPLILWHRGGSSTAAVRQVVEGLLESLPNVPERAARLRRQIEKLQPDERETHPGRGLAVLWDNARRVPRAPLVKSG